MFYDQIYTYSLFTPQICFISEVARNLGYTIDYIPLYRDMSSRDLLQRRSTTPKGDTVWDVRIQNFKSQKKKHRDRKRIAHTYTLIHMINAVNIEFTLS